MAELLERIPPEKCWAITAKILLNFIFLRGSISVVPLLGMGEGIIAPVWGWEKFREINTKIWAEINKKLLLYTKEKFNISVEDAVDAVHLICVMSHLQSGPEWEYEYSEATRERVVLRNIKCPWWERYKEFKIKPELSLCDVGHQSGNKEGLKAINPKINYKMTKARPWGDPYCEDVYEFTE